MRILHDFLKKDLLKYFIYYLIRDSARDFILFKFGRKTCIMNGEKRAKGNKV